MTIASTSTTPTMNFSFTITVTLNSEDLALYAKTVAVTIAESTNSLVGTKTLSPSTGTVAFSFYFSSTGIKTISASVPASGSFISVSKTIVIDVKSLILVFSAYTPTVKFT